MIDLSRYAAAPCTGCGWKKSCAGWEEGIGKQRKGRKRGTCLEKPRGRKQVPLRGYLTSVWDHLLPQMLDLGQQDSAAAASS